MWTGPVTFAPPPSHWLVPKSVKEQLAPKVASSSFQEAEHHQSQSLAFRFFSDEVQKTVSWLSSPGGAGQSLGVVS